MRRKITGGNMKAYDQQTIDEIRALYRQGISTYELADQYYCCRQTIWEYVKGIKDRSRRMDTNKLTNRQINDIRRFLQMGLKKAVIIRRLGISKPTLYRYINLFKVGA
jgi:DNA invertase Pin-like site-specific DNA recombinase